MTSVSRFLTSKLRLKVNETKSTVARPEERKFLGFTISNDGSEWRIAPKALDKFKERIREPTSRTRGISLPQIIEELTPYLIGWRSYFGFCRPLARSRSWGRGSAEDCARILGGNGATGTIASKNCAGVAYQSSEQRSRPARRWVSGAMSGTRRSKRPCATTTSIPLVSPDFMFRSRLKGLSPDNRIIRLATSGRWYSSIRCGNPMTHDYKRYGTTTLFAAREVATGKVIGQACRDTGIRNGSNSCAASIERHRSTSPCT